MSAKLRDNFEFDDSVLRRRNGKQSAEENRHVGFS